MKFVRDGDAVHPVLTVEEARERLERIRPLYAALRYDWVAMVKKRDQHDDFLKERQQSASEELDETVARLAKDIERLQQRIEERVEEIGKIGALVKSSPEEGLIDFYSEREGKLVLLCWKWGEEELSWWHDVESGFAGRQPI